MVDLNCSCNLSSRQRLQFLDSSSKSYLRFTTYVEQLVPCVFLLKNVVWLFCAAASQIFPVLIGDFDKAANQFGNPFAGCLPYDAACPDICVEKVEADLRAHMASQGLGSPTDPTGTVKKGTYKCNVYHININKCNM